MYMKYLITGGLGFIGTNLNTKLTGHTNDLIHLVDINYGTDLTSDKLSLYCDNLIHLASDTNVRTSILYPKDHISHNIAMTLNCLENARRHNSVFIFTSSMGAPLSMSPYSASKLACESFCKAYHESYNLAVKVLRLSNVYGNHSIYKSSVIAKFIKQALDKEPLMIIGDGYQTRDFVHVDDVVNTLTDSSLGSMTCVGSGKATTILEIAKMIQHLSTTLTSYTPELTFSPALSGEIINVDTYTDISPTINIEEGLRTTFKWFIENYKC